MWVGEQATVEGCPDDGGMQFYHEVRAIFDSTHSKIEVRQGMDYTNVPHHIFNL